MYYSQLDIDMEKIDMCLKHLSLLEEFECEKQAVLEIRSHVGWYLKGMPGSARIKDQVCKEHDFNNVKNIIKAYLNVEEQKKVVNF